MNPEPSGATPYVDGLNLYEGLLDNPVNLLDPAGTKTVTDWTSVEALEHWKSGGGEAVNINEGPFVKAVRDSADIKTWLAGVKGSIDSEIRNKIIPEMKSKNEWTRKYGVVRFPLAGGSFDSPMPTGRWWGMGTIHHTLDAYGIIWRETGKSVPSVQGSLDAVKVLTPQPAEKTSPPGAKSDDCKGTFYWAITLDVHGSDLYHSFSSSGRIVSGVMVTSGALLNTLNPFEWGTTMIPMPYNIYWGWKDYVGGTGQ